MFRAHPIACRICGNNKFKQVIDFGKNPLVNSLVEKEDLNKEELTYPLVVEQCQDCHLVQIVNPVHSDEIYRNVDYLYFSGDMPGLKDYFQEYADDIKKRFIKKGDFVVEIGSNDGLMLGLLQDKAKVLGVDPATNTTVRAIKNGIPTVSDAFTERIAKSIKREFGEAKVIYGNNCIAHIDNLYDVMKGVKTLLVEDDGVFIVECNYWGGMVENKNYSLIYHDHFSYFTLKNWIDFVDEFEICVFDAVVTPAQGGSLRVFIKNNNCFPKTMRYLKLLRKELDTNLNSYETCQKYEKECRTEAKKLGDLIRKLKAEGNSISGYGAAAKGFSILKLADIDERHLDYFVDDSSAKQGKYTPVNHIPVISRKEAENKLPDYFFITAPNYADVIIEKEKKNNYKGKFILANTTII